LEAILLPDTGKGERRTRLRTIRLPESLERALEKEATDEGSTVNAEINSTLSQHFVWDKKAKEFGFASIHKTLLTSMLEGLDDEMLARIGREVMTPLWKEMAEYWSQDSSPDGILNHLMDRSRFNPHHQTRITREENTYTVVLRHDFGPKWSILTKNALQELVRQSFHTEPQITAGESVVTAHFKVNPRKSPT